MTNRGKGISRRRFLTGTAATAAATIVPRHVLGGQGKTAPSDVITCGLVGCGAGETVHGEIGLGVTRGERPFDLVGEERGLSSTWAADREEELAHHELARLTACSRSAGD